MATGKAASKQGISGQATKAKSSFTALGVSGLPRYAGYIFDEWLKELQGSRGRRVLREMSDNSAPVGAMLFAIEMLIREVSWTVAPGTDDQAGQDAAQFVFECLHDMETPWEDILADILSMFIYGWSLFEQVYKKRTGDGSKYDDGKIGWQGWQMRGQETLLRWDYTDFHANYPEAFIQLGPPDFMEHTIPMNRCLLFRTTTRRANPEGRSLLRNAYRSWYMAKHLEAVEAIGAERDMAGLPVGLVPSDVLAGDAAPEQQAIAQVWRDLVTNIRRDEQEGVLIPSDRDDNGHLIWDLKLLSTGGQRQFNLGDVIERYEQRILMTLLCDFIMLGHTNVGTQSLGVTKIQLFSTAISSYLAIIASQINDVAIPRLLKLNGMDVKHPPQVRHGQVERMDLDTLGNFVYQMGQAGFVLDTDPQGALANHLLEQAHLPPNPVGLTNPFPDQWEAIMPNPEGMPPSPGNTMPQPLGSQRPGPGQIKEVIQEKIGAPGAAPAQPPPNTSAGPKRPTLARPSIKEPNMPDAPKAHPPRMARGPLASNGKLAMQQRRQRQLSESESASLARRMSEAAAQGDLKCVAFDLDNTALRFPQILVPMANLLVDNGVKVGVLTGNDSAAAHEQWNALGYPDASFYLAHPEGDPTMTAQWKAEQCKALDVDVLIDDFSGGRHVGTFQHFVDRTGGKTLALEVVLPTNTSHQHAGDPAQHT